MNLTSQGRPVSISKSSLTSFEVCETYWMNTYYLGQWQKPTLNMIIGNCVHKAIQRFCESKIMGKRMSLENFTRIAEVEMFAEIDKGIWWPYGYSSKMIKEETEKYNHDLKRFAQKWYELESETIQPYLIEQGFEIPINISGETITLKGYLDVIDRHPDIDGAFRLRDYKFGWKKKAQSVADTDPGLTAYHIANTFKFKLNIIEYRLDTYTAQKTQVKYDPLITTRDDSDIAGFLDRVAFMCEKIRLKMFGPAPIGIFKCNPDSCQFYFGCDRRQRSSK